MISIPTPCSEDWSNMTPNEKGAFCKRCCKTVIDFTSKTTEEIIAVISSAGKVCGKMRSGQLDSIPVRGKWGRLNAFACAVMLAFGATLFSCSNNNDHVVGEVAYIPADSVQPVNTDTVTGNNNSEEITAQADPVKPAQDTMKNKKQPVTKEAAPAAGEQQDQPKRPNPLPLEPRWNGGSSMETQKAIRERVKYPEEAKKNNVTGTVWVDFMVKSNGETTNFKVRQGLGHGCDEEAIRVIKSLGKWDPGKQGGKPVDMEYSVAVPFENK